MLNSELVIGITTFLIALGSIVLRPKDVKWFAQLERPSYMVFEPAIPFIWTVIFICGAWSANIVWQSDPGSFSTWLIMGLYVLLEALIVSYFPIMLWSERLTKGIYIGSIGVALGLILTFMVSKISGSAALLLFPYLIWAPIGTYTTWRMSQLNPRST